MFPAEPRWMGFASEDGTKDRRKFGVDQTRWAKNDSIWRGEGEGFMCVHCIILFSHLYFYVEKAVFSHKVTSDSAEQQGGNRMSNIFHGPFNSTVNLSWKTANCHQFIGKVKGKEIKQYFSAGIKLLYLNSLPYTSLEKWYTIFRALKKKEFSWKSLFEVSKIKIIKYINSKWIYKP